MTTILGSFFIALVFSLVGTPLAGKLGRLTGAIDRPDERKVHSISIPRSGGIAIFVAFGLTVSLSDLFGTTVSQLFLWDIKNITFFVGAVIVFAAGFVDDIHRLSPRIKLLFQILAASVAFAGGFRITSYYFTSVSVESVIISYFLTVFWFVLLINAINLIDGLDGLAAGITFFVCAILTTLLVWRDEYLPATLFAALGGSVLGFLRYNFNPASVFMGDGGSYFLGYAIAGLSIIGTAKAQTATVVLIPLLAMGVPVFDTILSPIRRFIVGKKPFQPDKSHIHHKLLEMGLSTKKSVLLIYGISVVLCLFAIAVVNIKDRRAGLFLVIVGIAALVFTRKLGYFEYIASDKVFGWFRDMTDAVGLSQSRRSFLGLQIEISRSRTIEDLWGNVCQALEFLRVDRADLYLRAQAASGSGGAVDHYDGEERRIGKITSQRGGGSVSWQTIGPNGQAVILHWAREGCRREEDTRKGYMLRVELPLMNGSPETAKTFILYKDAKREQIDGFILRRIEQLRETMMHTLDLIEREVKGKIEPATQAAVDPVRADMQGQRPVNATQGTLFKIKE